MITTDTVSSVHSSMEQIDIKGLEEAVVIFYKSTSQEQAATHEWLTKAQSSLHAWSFSWELMQPGKVWYTYGINFHQINFIIFICNN